MSRGLNNCIGRKKTPSIFNPSPLFPCHSPIPDPMPLPIDHHHHHADPQSEPKPNPKLLSLFLKSIIMLLITTLFFLFLGFAAFVLLHLFLLGGAFHRLRLRPTTHLPPPSNGLAPRDVKKLPHFRVSDGSEPGPGTQCVVCLDGFRNGQWCRKLVGCGHVFHRRCVDTWLVKVAACPTCRTPVRLNARAPPSAVDEDARQFWVCGNSTNVPRIL